MNTNKFTTKQGEAKVLTLTVVDELGNVVNLSATTLLLGFKKDKSDASYLFSKIDTEFDKSQAAQGIVTVGLLTTDTDQNPGLYVGELKCTWSGTSVEKSLDIFMEILQAVTT